MNKPIAEYDLYFDESGDFQETSTVAEERETSKTGETRRASSQFAGLLAPSGKLNGESARLLLQNVAQSVGLESILHGTEIQDREIFNRTIAGVITGIEANGWQPIRMVNKEAIVYGDRATTHINLASEMVVRVFQQLQTQHNGPIALRVVPARIVLGKLDDGSLDTIADSEYEIRLRETIGFINVRRGLAYQANQWQLRELQIGSARRDPELILCDLISNASYANFRRLDSEEKQKLRHVLGHFDFSLGARDVMDRIEFHVQEGSLGLAIIALAENRKRRGMDSRLLQLLDFQRVELTQKLAVLPARLRDLQLAHILNWLQQIIEGQRKLLLGRELLDWVRAMFLPPLRAQLLDAQESLAWFDFSLATIALTACNHSGLLNEGALERNKIDSTAPLLACQWEHSHVMSRGLIAVAVHNTDCFEFDVASESMRRLVACDESLASLFVDELYGSQSVPRSDIRAQSLGTWLQSEMFAGKLESSRLQVARALSERVLKEFSDPHDLVRQQQYRCQLETIAKDFQAAKAFLAMSLGLSDANHRAIAEAIVQLRQLSPIGEGFAMLHWLRLGIGLLNSEDSDKSTFIDAIDKSGIFGSPWCQAAYSYYPVHGIVRRVAYINGWLGRHEQANTAVRHFRNALDATTKKCLSLLMINIATLAEVAAFEAKVDQRKARELLEKGASSIQKRIKAAHELGLDSMPRIKKWMVDMEQAVDQWLKEPNPNSLSAPQKLALELAQQVDY